MTIIQSIRNYFLTCPLLTDGKVNVDFIDKDIDTTYNIDPIPTNPVIKKFVDGASERQFTFIFSSCEPWGDDVLQNLDNNGFYEELTGWIERNKELPILDRDKKPLRIEILTPGYLMSNSADRAYYQIQLRLVYYQERTCR